MIQTTNGRYSLVAPLPLAEGGLFPRVHLAWEAVGKPSAEGTLVVLHDALASHRGLAGPPCEGWSPHGWAQKLYGGVLPEGCPLLFLNLLGSPFGSTCAALGEDFPELSVEDMARASAAALRGLGVERARALVGVGLGGQVALELASRFPNLCAGVVALGTGMVLPQSLRQQLAMTPQLLAADPDPAGGPTFRKLGVELLRRHYGREYLAASFPDAFSAERALDEQAAQLVRAFPAQAWASLAQAWAGCDLRERLKAVRAEVLLISCATDEVAPPLRVRDAYHALTAGGARAHYYELQSEGGHHSLTQEAGRLRGPVADLLGRLR